MFISAEEMKAVELAWDGSLTSMRRNRAPSDLEIQNAHRSLITGYVRTKVNRTPTKNKRRQSSSPPIAAGNSRSVLVISDEEGNDNDHRQHRPKTREDSSMRSNMTSMVTSSRSSRSAGSSSSLSSSNSTIARRDRSGRKRTLSEINDSDKSRPSRLNAGSQSVGPRRSRVVSSSINGSNAQRRGQPQRRVMDTTQKRRKVTSSSSVATARVHHQSSQLICKKRSSNSSSKSRRSQSIRDESDIASMTSTSVIPRSTERNRHRTHQRHSVSSSSSSLSSSSVGLSAMMTDDRHLSSVNSTPVSRNDTSFHSSVQSSNSMNRDHSEPMSAIDCSHSLNNIGSNMDSSMMSMDTNDDDKVEDDELHQELISVSKYLGHLLALKILSDRPALKRKKESTSSSMIANNDDSDGERRSEVISHLTKKEVRKRLQMAVIPIHESLAECLTKEQLNQDKRGYSVQSRFDEAKREFDEQREKMKPQTLF